MRLSSKLGILVAVVAIGALAAWPYRQDNSAKPAVDDETPSQVERRLHDRGPHGWTSQFQAAPEQTPPRRVPTASTSFAPETSPPEPPQMPSSYQRSFSPVGALLKPVDEGAADEGPVRLGQIDTLTAQEPSPPKREQTHKIVDGDTLSAIAERYLGSPERFRELFEYNRDVLRSPDLLPIGRSIKIPPESFTSSGKQISSGDVKGNGEPEKPMVAIPRGAFRAEEQ